MRPNKSFYLSLVIVTKEENKLSASFNILIACTCLKYKITLKYLIYFKLYVLQNITVIKIKFDLQLLDAIKNVVRKPKRDISDQSFIKTVRKIFK